MKKNLLILPQTLNFNHLEVNSWCNTRHHWIYASLSRMIRAGHLFRCVAQCAHIDGVVPTCRLTRSKWASLFLSWKLGSILLKAWETWSLTFLSEQHGSFKTWLNPYPTSFPCTGFLPLALDNGILAPSRPHFQPCSLICENASSLCSLSLRNLL